MREQRKLPGVTSTELSRFRSRMYSAYATDHAGRAPAAAAALIYRRNIRPLLPPRQFGAVLDLGCGRGDLVACLLADGYQAAGVDVSPEQVQLAQAAGRDTVRLGDYQAELDRWPGQLAAITACDFLEHLTRAEALTAFDSAAAALRPGGVLVGRVPNAVSPMGGLIRYGDITHETWFTAASVRQLAATAGFAAVICKSCPPVIASPGGLLRAAVWKPASALIKLALAAETGVRRGHIVTLNLMFAARRDDAAVRRGLDDGNRW